MDTPLRVMQLVLSLAIGGTEKLVYDIVHRIDKQRVFPVICCLDEFGRFGEELKQDSFPVHHLHRAPGIDWKLIRRLADVIQQERIDVIHAHQYTPYFYGLLTSFFCKARLARYVPKIVFTEHGRFYPDERKLKRYLLDPVLSLMTEEIVSISESTKASMVTYDNFPAHKIRVVYNGIDLSRFSHPLDDSVSKTSLGMSSGTPVVGIVARLDPIKNHAMLLHAFTQVLQHKPDAHLLIVGDGPEEQRLKSLTESLRIADNVMFLGARRDVPELLHLFDVFALSSFSEGTSVTLLEAMAVGLPVVATRVGGNPEVVEDQVTGYLVPNEHREEMAEKLLKLLQNRELCQKMGTAGQQRAYAKFSLEKMVTTYTDLYVKVCGRA